MPSFLRSLLVLATICISSFGTRAQPLPLDDLFAWAEWKWPELFSPSQGSYLLDYAGARYTLRSYPNGNNLGVTDSGRVAGLGPFTGGALADFGAVNDFARQVREDRCLFLTGNCLAPDRSEPIDRTATQWLVFRSTSALDGSNTTRLVGSATSGNFEIVCERGRFSRYYVTTTFITANGLVSYRIGRGAVVNQTWQESPANGYKVLFPPSNDLALLQKLYRSNELVLVANRYGGGTATLQPRVVGFSSAIDRTRADCGWSSTAFPPVNGWGVASKPDLTPPHANVPVYADAATQSFSFSAWRATTSAGTTALLVRVAEDKSRCRGSFVIGPRAFYVTQGGRQVEAVPGHELSLSCSSQRPVTLALQGDFDPRQPLILTGHPFHFNALSPGEPFATISIDDR